MTLRDGRALMTLVREAAHAAAKVIRDATPRRAQLDWQQKGRSDFVTEVDVGAERSAIEVLQRAEPGAGFVAEESGRAPGTGDRVSGLQFIIDPLDGTTNFLHGVPDYAVSIGAVVDGGLVAGVVYSIPRDECFTAFAGGGAWLGDTQLRVSGISEPTKALVGTGCPFKDPAVIPEYVAQMSRVMKGTGGIRRPGAASIDLASVAAGRFDAFWETRLSPWDIAAGILLVREAGGVCTDFDGATLEPAFSSVVAGNPAMHAWLLRTLNDKP
ncbi:MAG TPA: inositol monophosphatase family protein [Gemmatimonadaceae bacterium]|nr:inositol monophosphatase family protein [Gemmatimonadaceae bacterium]